eukprot:RCo004975
MALRYAHSPYSTEGLVAVVVPLPRRPSSTHGDIFGFVQTQHSSAPALRDARASFPSFPGPLFPPLVHPVPCFEEGLPVATPPNILQPHGAGASAQPPETRVDLSVTFSSLPAHQPSEASRISRGPSATPGSSLSLSLGEADLVRTATPRESGAGLGANASVASAEASAEVGTAASAVIVGRSCDHTTAWKRLRGKRGFGYFICRECGAKWKSKSRQK